MSEENIKTMQFDSFVLKSFELLENENNMLKEQYEKMENYYLKNIKQLKLRLNNIAKYVKDIEEEQFVNTEHYVKILELAKYDRK